MSTTDPVNVRDTGCGGTVPAITTGALSALSRVRELHHGRLRAQLLQLVALVGSIGVINGDRREELNEARRQFAGLRAALELSMTSVEDLLALTEHDETEPRSHRSIAAADEHIARLLNRLETLGAHLRSLRRVTARYYVPSDGCGYESFYRKLAGIDAVASIYVDDTAQAVTEEMTRRNSRDT